MVRPAVPLQPIEVHGGAEIHLQLVEDPCQSRWVPEGGCDPMENPHWSRFAGRTCDPMGEAGWNRLFLKGCTPWKEATPEQFMKNCSLWEGLMLEKFMEGPHTGAEEEYEELYSEEDEAADNM
ncbi:hypothetical protein AV530_005964 [Patagioenas fasciata monilis]|uniref:Uncharacterized protein n=1 Tax=Patagioenas fasciata monilis TaxID=372326 RepID=A0A1V4JNG9_PATFA|nr:hypothetical protein AV530_005964 [Patagioenas fasciata monilis]